MLYNGAQVMKTSYSTIKSLERWAWLLDKSVPIPGTSYRMGMDSLIGLIPGLGDWLGGMISSYLLWHAVQNKVPAVIVGRMAVNVALDTFLGMIPIVGDIFDIAFKSNEYNLRLLEQYNQLPQEAVKQNSLFMIVFFIVLLSLIGLSLWLAIKLLAWIITSL
jgi:hypothetical protein